jgi:hypothetical protein
MDVFQKYAEQSERDQRLARLLRAITRHAFDGTELHGVVNASLPGLENELIASNLRHAILAQYRDTVPLDVVIVALLETEELREGTNK